MMTEEQKKKEQEAIVRKPYAPVNQKPLTATQGRGYDASSQLPSAQVTQTVEPAYPSIYERYLQRRDAAATNAETARKRWRQAYDETGDVMAGFIPKPKDTSDEQKYLRRVAMTQALGELIGAIGQGVIASGRGGEGYVTAPLGMYNRTIEQLQQLKDRGLTDRKDYENMMARLRMQHAQEALRMEEKEAERADAEVQALDKVLANYGLQLQKQQEQRSQKAEEREHNAEQKRLDRENAIRAAQIRAASGKKQEPTVGLTDEENRILYAMLPKERFVKTIDNEGKERVVVQPYSKYPEEQLRAFSSIAKRLSKAGATEQEVIELADLLVAKGKDWSIVSSTIDRGIPIKRIIEHVRKLPDAKNPNSPLNSTQNGKR